MRCFEKLVKSHFLANVSKELEMARRTIESMSHPTLPKELNYDSRERRRVYKQFVFDCFLIEEMIDTVNEMEPGDREMIFYIQLIDAVFIYSMKKKQVDEAVRYNWNVNGSIPYFRGRHSIKGITIHTALVNTTYTFTPSSVN